MIELIRADQYTKMLWKNGAGFTLEIARSQGESDFEWRISMADVTTSGPFSLCPNKQRIISVLDGQGMVLHVDNLPATTLNQGDIFAFPDWKEVIRKVGQYGFTPLLSTKIPDRKSVV